MSKKAIVRNLLLTVAILIFPILCMVIDLTFFPSSTPRTFGSGTAKALPLSTDTATFLSKSIHWSVEKLFFLVCLIGVLEILLGIYQSSRQRKELALNLICNVGPIFLLLPIHNYFAQTSLNLLLPDLQNSFARIPWYWAGIILLIADDLSQYWFHRLHHEIPFLWKFHRAHHTSPDMGVVITNRQNLFYSFFMSNHFVKIILIYLGFGGPVLLLMLAKGTIALSSHSRLLWDKPLYKFKFLHPVAWVVERLIVTPSTHHAHHALIESSQLPYCGNFSNMFFIWDIIFRTGQITRSYPKSYGIENYQQEELSAQWLWPLVKSKKARSELACLP